MQSAVPSPTVVTYVEGKKFAIKIGSHEIFVDQAVDSGGCDSAPTPIALLGASLGSCIAFYVHHFFHKRGLACDDIRVEVVQRSASGPSRIEDFAVKVFLPFEIPEKYLPLLDRVIEACPAHYTLAHGAKIAVEVEAAAPVPALA
jgi:putative redox protein